MKTLTLLAIETSTNACSTALMDEGKVCTRFEVAPKAHTALITPMIQSVLTEQSVALEDLQAIAFGCGPGSFTGVRIATSVATAFSYGLNIPIYPISTLEALAYEAIFEVQTPYTIISALDARMGEVYVAVYVCANQTITRVLEECLVGGVELSKLLSEASTSKIICVGSGWDVYPSHHSYGKEVEVVADAYPQALNIVRIANQKWQAGDSGLLAHQALPTYIRNKVAERSLNQQRNQNFLI